MDEKAIRKIKEMADFAVYRAKQELEEDESLSEWYKGRAIGMYYALLIAGIITATEYEDFCAQF